MNFDNIFEGLDLDSPLTDDELDYLDILGKNPIEIIEVRKLPEEPPNKENKSLDIFDSPDVELVSINDYEISGS